MALRANYKSSLMQKKIKKMKILKKFKEELEKCMEPSKKEWR